MIFLKHFDVNNQTLLGIAKLYVKRESKVGDLCGAIANTMHWDPKTPMKLYEVSRSSLFLSAR